MKRVIKAATVVMMICVLADAKGFTASFGNGGMERYDVGDNVCYGYMIKTQKNKNLVALLNQVLTVSIQKVKKSYAKQYDGFINIRYRWGTYGNDTILYQVCGDLVKRR